MQVQVKGSGFNNNGKYIISGSGFDTISDITNGDPGFVTLASLNVTSTTISNIRVTSDTNVDAMLAQVVVNGKILVDAGSVGDNGFYLPFDPSAEGVNYSSTVTYEADSGTPYEDPDRPFSNIFDGDRDWETTT